MEGLTVDEQLEAWGKRALDPRASVPLGIGSIDTKLYRGGLQPGLLVILGGRTHTRKTGTMLNLMARMMRGGTAVGLIGLDEPTPAYVARLCSTLTVSDFADGSDGYDAEWLEDHWHEKEAEAARRLYVNQAKAFTLSKGTRPSMDALSSWLDAALVRPEVVFIDYLQYLFRGQYDGNDNTRVPRLAEELAVWTGKEDVVTIALHQVGRESKSSGHHYHGDTPMQLESLRSGGEEAADIVLGTYRPALNPLGNMTADEAEADLGEDFNEERWQKAADRVKRYEHSTFLQLLKNRPSQRGLHLRGVELFAPGSSMFQRERLPEDLDDEQSAYDQEVRRASE